MTNLQKIIALTFISLIVAGCGTNAPATNSNAANTAVVSAPETTSNTADRTSANAGGMQPAYNGETKEIADGFPVPTNANVTVVDTNQAKDTMREKPAPDDSTFSAEMNAKGQPVETRTFRSHPILSKVEKITMSPRDYIFKVYLKSGKVVETKSAKLKDFRVIAPENILDAVGLKPPPPKPDPNAPKPEDKKKPVMIPKANP